MRNVEPAKWKVYARTTSGDFSQSLGNIDEPPTSVR